MLKFDALQESASGVVSEIKSRFDGVPGLDLKSVEQKDTELVIKGESPNDAAVTRFGQTLEFSSGMFTNLNIETERQTAKAVNTVENTAAAPSQQDSKPAAPAQQDQSAPGPEVVTFTIKCNYARNSGQQNTTSPASTAPANHVAKN